MNRGKLLVSGILMISILLVFVGFSPRVYAGVNDTECTPTNGNTQGGGQWWWAYEIKTNATSLNVASISVNPAGAGGSWKAALYLGSSQTLGAGNPTTYVSGSYAGPYSIPAGGFHAEVPNGTVTLAANTVYWIVTAFSSGTTAIWGKGTPCTQYFAHIQTGDYTNFPIADTSSSGWATGGESTGLYLTFATEVTTTTTTTTTTTNTTTTSASYTTYNFTQTNTSTIVSSTTTNMTTTLGNTTSTSLAVSITNATNVETNSLNLLYIAIALIIVIVVGVVIAKRRGEGM